MKYDFVGIGDTVVDAFIKLREARIHCKINKEQCEICMQFGSKIPYDSVDVVAAVGNSANATVAAARLGLSSALITNIGDDIYADDCLRSLRENNVSVEYVKKNSGKKTNYHYVLWYEDDRTILIKHEKYKYSLPEMEAPKWLYLSSLGEDSIEFNETIKEFLEPRLETKLIFQPGTFQSRSGFKSLSYFYKRAEVFISNKEEAEQILSLNTTDIKELLKKMHELGPSIVLITVGPEGAYAYDGSRFLFMPPYPDPKPPFERTGAGDAFSSTVAIALAKGLDLETALMWGPINAMSVVQKVGAQAGLLTEKELHKLLEEAPNNYKVRLI